MVQLRLGFPLPAGQVRKPAAIEVLSESLLAGTLGHDRAGFGLGGAANRRSSRGWCRRRLVPRIGLGALRTLGRDAADRR